MSKPLFVLNDHYENWINLNPLTLTKPISFLRVGISTIKEKWEYFLQNEVQVKTCMPYLNGLDTWKPVQDSTCFFINSSVLPNADLSDAILKLQMGESLYHQNELIASYTKIGGEHFEKEISYTKNLVTISYPWDIFSKNDEVLRDDFEHITHQRTSAKLSSTNTLIGPENQVFIEEGASVEGAILNTQNGPIYVGRDSEIMEGSVIRGGLALCHNAVLKLSSKIYGATTIGPHSKVGGEVNNSVIQGYSNKGHDGFLGNSVIGEWCNLGADTNNSNLKNNYGEVKVYSYKTKDQINSHMQFLGLLMGDHSKCGINTMFNTGTVVGVFANIFGGDFPPKYIPSFSWGGASGFTSYKWDAALEVAERVMERRKLRLSENDKSILKFIHETS